MISIPILFNNEIMRPLFFLFRLRTQQNGVAKFIENAVPWKELVTIQEAFAINQRNSEGPASNILIVPE